jgi:hypothetical protein
MRDWFEGSLVLCSGALGAAAFAHKLRAYRPLLLGGGILLLITAVYPRPGNRLGEYVFGPAVEACS